ncbi:Ig-like domain-containing protein [Butyrivibrio sp. LC3010]|uniref:Ig-like domain-containing protein n=1 Tax=Butyrivibrio sp. LC3010 TaxID=1280680 RepID=UPI000418C89C|nr:Ig-like domain-containing protein [Butyrivibrio sp. LC3010]
MNIRKVLGIILSTAMLTSNMVSYAAVDEPLASEENSIMSEKTEDETQSGPTDDSTEKSDEKQNETADVPASDETEDDSDNAPAPEYSEEATEPIVSETQDSSDSTTAPESDEDANDVSADNSEEEINIDNNDPEDPQNTDNEEQVVNEENKEEVSEQEQSEETVTEISTTTENLEIVVKGDNLSGITVQAKEIELSDEIFADYGEQSKSVTILQAVDIILLDEEGNEWQPIEYGKTVNVEIKGISLPDSNEDISVVRIDDDVIEGREKANEDNIEVVISEVLEETESVEFEAEHFTVYAVLNNGPSITFSGGEGTKDNPYIIVTPDDFYNIRNNLGSYFVLANDISLSGYTSWSPIGNADTPFTGNINGNGHVISGLTFSTGSLQSSTSNANSYDVGLFGCIGNKVHIENLKLSDVNSVFTTDKKVSFGALIGRLSVANVSDVVIQNCSVSGNIQITITDQKNSSSDIGGLIGYIYTGCSIINCVNRCPINVSSTNSTSYGIYVGGISGTSNTEFNKCINYGNIECHTSRGVDAGGITGGALYSNIYECTNYGDIYAQNSYTGSLWNYWGFCDVGGIAGHTGSEINECRNYGNISSVGNEKNNKPFAGGICGYRREYAQNTIENNINYCSDIVASEEYSGRICGYMVGGGGLQNNYSIATTKINGVAPSNEIGVNDRNGADLNSITKVGVIKLVDSWSLVFTNGETYSFQEDNNSSNQKLIDKANKLIGRKVRLTLQNELIISIEDFSSTNSYGSTNSNQLSKEKIVQKELENYDKSISDYLKTLSDSAKDDYKKTNSKTTSVGKSLRAIDESDNTTRMIMMTANTPSDAVDAVYEILAQYFGECVTTASNLGKISLSDNAVQIDAKIVKKVVNNMNIKEYTGRYGKYRVKFNTIGYGSSYAGSVTVYGPSYKQYMGTITSGYKESAAVMTRYVNEVSDLAKNTYREALLAVVEEFASNTYIGEFTQDEINSFISSRQSILEAKGYGNLSNTLGVMKKSFDKLYKLFKAEDEDVFTTELKDGQKYYDALKSYDLVDENVSIKKLKDKIDKVKYAKSNLENALFDYLYDNNLYHESLWNKIKKVFINCPVDVTVTDAEGNILAYTSDDIAYVNDRVNIEVNGDQKIIYIPNDGEEYTIKIDATDDGIMNYTVEEINNFEVVGRLNYYGIELISGKSFSQTLDDNWNESVNDFPIVGDNTILASEYIKASDENACFNITYNKTGEGTVLGSGKYPKGDPVTLIACPDEGYTFDGWYDGDYLLETDSVYRFAACNDICVSAKFRNIPLKDTTKTIVLNGIYDEFADVSVYKSSGELSNLCISAFGADNLAVLNSITIKHFDKDKKIISDETNNSQIEENALFWLYDKNLSNSISELYDSSETLIATIYNGDIPTNEPGTDPSNGEGEQGDPGGNESGNDSHQESPSNNNEEQSKPGGGESESETKQEDSSNNSKLVNTISLNYSKLTLGKGGKFTLQATLSPDGSTTLTWKSSNTKVATVNKNGTITAKKKGNCNITVSTTDGKVSATCKLTVKKDPIKVKKASVNKKKVTLKKGKSYSLVAGFKPFNATIKSISYKTSNKKIATVSKKGVIKGKKKGTCTITVTVKDKAGKSKTAKCKVTVK